MQSKTYVKPSLEAVVHFWGASDWRTTKPLEVPRLKLVEVHPTKTLVLAADRDGKIMLWDYERHSALVDTSSASLLLKSSAQPEIKQINSPVQSLRHPIFPASGPFKEPSLSTYHAPSPDANLVNSFSPAVVSKVKQQIGQVLQVCFADTAYATTTLAEGDNSSSLYARNFLSDYKIAIVCENMVIFYDYVSGEVTSLTSSELNKANPTSVEFPNQYSCLIGCSDGVTRVWNWTFPSSGNSRVVVGNSGVAASAPPPPGAIALYLNSFTKTEVSLLKSIPVKQ